MELMRFTRLKANPKTLSLQFFFFLSFLRMIWLKEKSEDAGTWQDLQLIIYFCVTISEMKSGVKLYVTYSKHPRISTHVFKVW